MDGDTAFLARQFDLHHERLWTVAHRMLGSRTEAEEALRAARVAGLAGVDAWLTTVVARACVARLRARAALRVPDRRVPDRRVPDRRVPDTPSEGSALADGVDLALFVVLESLTPDERLALVLHDLFALPLPEVARLTGRTTEEATRLAHYARWRVRGGATENRMRQGGGRR